MSSASMRAWSGCFPLRHRASTGWLSYGGTRRLVWLTRVSCAAQLATQAGGVSGAASARARAHLDDHLRHREPAVSILESVHIG
eukprot:COSAG01_NODE_2158_length_8251_cov_8.554645_15_plen_84_part_00